MLEELVHTVNGHRFTIKFLVVLNRRATLSAAEQRIVFLRPLHMFVSKRCQQHLRRN